MGSHSLCFYPTLRKTMITLRTSLAVFGLAVTLPVYAQQSSFIGVVQTSNQLKTAPKKASKAPSAEQLDEAHRLNHLALLYYKQGKYAEAEPLYKRALAIDEK